MSSRTLALAMTVVGAGSLFLLADDPAASALGLVAALIALAALWLASARTRTTLAVLSALLWLGALVLGAFASAWAVIGCLIGLSAAVVIVSRGSRWPGFSARYARGADVDQDEDISPRQLWESLDRGHDPTRGKDTTFGDEPGRG